MMKYLIIILFTISCTQKKNTKTIELDNCKEAKKYYVNYKENHLLEDFVNKMESLTGIESLSSTGYAGTFYYNDTLALYDIAIWYKCLGCNFTERDTNTLNEFYFLYKDFEKNGKKIIKTLDVDSMKILPIREKEVGL